MVILPEHIHYIKIYKVFGFKSVKKWHIAMWFLGASPQPLPAKQFDGWGLLFGDFHWTNYIHFFMFPGRYNWHPFQFPGRYNWHPSLSQISRHDSSFFFPRKFRWDFFATSWSRILLCASAYLWSEWQRGASPTTFSWNFGGHFWSGVASRAIRFGGPKSGGGGELWWWSLGRPGVRCNDVCIHVTE